MKIFLHLVQILALTSCFESPQSSQTSSHGSSDGSQSNQGQVGTSGNNNSSGQNSTDSGQSGTGGGSSHTIPKKLDLLLAGHKAWLPGNYSSSLATQTNITPEEAQILFRTDSVLKLKFKVNPQPVPPTGDEFCYGRQTGQSPLPDRYEKLNFRVSLRDIKCDNPDPNNPNNCLSNLYLGPRYSSMYVGPVSVGSYSQVLDLSSQIHITNFATTVEVDYVRSDSYCKASSGQFFCPAEREIQQGSCWHMTMEIETNF